jgi:hypothetical protein
MRRAKEESSYVCGNSCQSIQININFHAIVMFSYGFRFASRKTFIRIYGSSSSNIFFCLPPHTTVDIPLFFVS